MNADNIRKFLSSYRNRRIGIGFSGGADSTALLLLTWQAAVELNIDLIAIHFNHGIRGNEANRDAEWCAEFCAARNIPFRQVALQVRKNTQRGESIESAARRLRLQFWHNFAATQPPSIIALAHHADDALENLFIRLCRGANSSGATSLRPETFVSGTIFIRPLLDCHKNELIDWLQTNGITDWREDVTNRDERIVRNFFRNNIIPAIIRHMPPAACGLHSAMKNLRIDAEYLESQARLEFEKMCSGTAVPVSFWRELPEALLPRVLRLWLSSKTNLDIIPNGECITQFIDALTARRREYKFTTGWRWCVAAGKCTVKPSTLPCHAVPKIAWSWATEPELSLPNGAMLKAKIIKKTPHQLKIKTGLTVYFDATAMPAKLMISGREDGDKMVPFGTTSLVKVKKLVIDAKPSEVVRRNTTVCRCGDKIIWLVGIRRSNDFPVTTATKAVLRLSYTPPTE